MTVITDTTLINLEDATPATMTVAMFKQEPHDFPTNNSLVGVAELMYDVAIEEKNISQNWS